ncbi:alpha/beta hydrolase [Nocardioides sp. BP30]|uniref:alpha/beta fold hydrolase n=1 Tax=Nocardioides sp. BP30 TaxID=3036374 RepID=UPI0024689913|nr:alpha/beta hydrolase [Nocardioides sp. BP30]WGL51655.1 alpha/beta hydrolase [Nocardioides sp. BP30]
MNLAPRLNVAMHGPAEARPIVFVHGFGCGQLMWRHVAPAFAEDHRVVLLDLPGAGDSDLSLYRPERYTGLEAYRDDLVALLEELDLTDAVFVGHSVSAMIGVLVANAAPGRVGALVLVAPSARYLDDEGYLGGFSERDIEELLGLMERNHLGWQDPLAGLVAGAAPAEVKLELEDSFCRTRPDIAAQFAAVTFRGDNRADLVDVRVPTLIVQSSDDAVAPMSAGAFIRDQIPDSIFTVIETHGHCPHLSAPVETVAALREFLDRR